MIWKKNILEDYDIIEEVLTLYYDTLSVINISKNHVQCSRTKHIVICYHNIRSLVRDKIIDVRNISTETHLDDIFTKGLGAAYFETLGSSLDLYVP